MREKAPLQNDFDKIPGEGRTGVEFGYNGQPRNIWKKNRFDKKRMGNEEKLKVNGFLARGYYDWVSGPATFAAILRNVPRRTLVRFFIFLTAAARLLLS